MRSVDTMFSIFHFTVFLVGSVCETSQKGAPRLDSPVHPSAPSGACFPVSHNLPDFLFSGGRAGPWEGRGHYPGFCICGPVPCQQNPQQPAAEAQSPATVAVGAQRGSEERAPGRAGQRGHVSSPASISSFTVLPSAPISACVPFLSLPFPGHRCTSLFSTSRLWSWPLPS